MALIYPKFDGAYLFDSPNGNIKNFEYVSFAGGKLKVEVPQTIISKGFETTGETLPIDSNVWYEVKGLIAWKNMFFQVKTIEFRAWVSDDSWTFQKVDLKTNTNSSQNKTDVSKLLESFDTNSAVSNKLTASSNGSSGSTNWLSVGIGALLALMLSFLFYGLISKNKTPKTL